MTIYKIRKRNGSIVTFEKEKITNAIQAAFDAVQNWEIEHIPALVDLVISNVEAKIWNDIPDIEIIQDEVENVLMQQQFEDVAKAYITYRQKRAESRDVKNIVVEVDRTMDEYLGHLDWRINENANVWYSIWWLILKNSEKIVANYWLSKIYPAEVGNAHRNGDYHIHDLWMFTPYCAWWSLRQMLEEWFNGVTWKLASKPPRHLQSAVNQMVNFLWTLQNEWAGAQAFSSFDTYLAPFVHKYEVSIEKELDDSKSSLTWEERQKYIDERTYKYVKQNLQNFVFNMNVPSRWWCQTPFSNITLDWTCPEDLKEKSLMLWWIECWYYPKKFWELQKEMNLINKILIEIYTEWDANWAVFTFPIPTYNITEDFDWNGPNVDALFEMTAKYWIPYFQNFVGSQFKVKKDEKWNIVKVPNPNAYKPWAVRSMCCRLQLDLTVLEKRGWGLFGSAEMTWSIWVVTINLPRIWYNFKWDKEWFKNQILYLMNLAKTSLEIKRKEMTKWLNSGLYPFTKRYLPSFRNHFSTIGVNWMNEAIQNFTSWKEDITTPWGMEFAEEILDFIREKLKEYQEETWNLYNLEATPWEGTTYRFAKEDKKQIPNIIQAGTDDAPYYTNSSQIPVGYTNDPFEALELQNNLQCLYTGWTVLHLYMWERISDATACKNLIKKVIENYQLPYITVSPVFSICPKHGYIAWEHDYCPKCDEEIWYTWEEFNMEIRKKHTDDPEKLEHLRRMQMENWKEIEKNN